MSKTVKPIETVYVNNLNDKVSLAKLKSSLQEIFAKYGKVLQITAHDNLKMKGQAFVTYDTVDASSTAVQKLQNYKLFDKPIRVSFAKGNSDSYFSHTEDLEPIAKRKIHKLEVEKQKQAKSDAHIVKKRKKQPAQPNFAKLPPNKILLIQNLLESTTNEVLEEFFTSAEGFISTRFIKVRNLAFIEFEVTKFATDYLLGVDTVALKEKFGENVALTYAKK
jgi:U2 small nuclear ribonucleoprotein B''